MSPQLEQLLTLVRRYPWCVACAVLTLGGGGGAWYLNGQLGDLETAHAERAKEGENTLMLLVGGSVQREELEATRQFTRRLEENLLVESDLPENSRYFYKIEEQTGTTLIELHQLNSPATDNNPLFRRVPFTMRLTGTYEQVAKFVRLVETGARLAKITGFTISRSGKETARADAAGLAPDPAASLVVLELNLEVLGKK